jgi:hypothetical protein
MKLIYFSILNPVYAVQELAAYAPNKSNEEVLAAAKSSFCKRTRTLYRYMYPNISKRDLEKTVLAAWDSSPDTEKQFHISKVTYFNNHAKAASLSLHPFSLVPERKAHHVMFNL